MEEAKVPKCAQDTERLRVLIDLAIAIGKREGLLKEVHDDTTEHLNGNHNVVPMAVKPNLSNISTGRKLPGSKEHVKCKY